MKPAAKAGYFYKLTDAQEIGQITVEAAQKMGELLLQIQKQSGKRTDLTSPDSTEKLKTKSEITSEMGMTSQQVSQYQQIAQNPEAVKVAIQKAIDNGDVVSRNQVMKEIRSAKAELERQLAEKDRKISELENQKPEIKEKDVKDLIESNLKQRVPGNSNPVKLGRCFAFLEEYYGAKHGGNRKSSGNDYRLKSQVDIANEVGLSPETIRAYKRLASAIPEIQELVETGKVSPTTALSIISIRQQSKTHLMFYTYKTPIEF